MATPDTTKKDFVRPLDTVAAAVDDLGSQWYSLPEAAQASLAAILAGFRTRLSQAEGDIARGSAVQPFLFALEDAPHLPASTAALLAGSPRRERTRAILTLESERARELVGMIDRLLGPDAGLAPSPDSSASDEIFADPAKIAERVISRLNGAWGDLSLAAQDQAALWLRSFDDGLFGASNDYERLLATTEFLRQIKGDPAVFAVVEDAFTVRSAGIPSFGPGGAAMSQQAAGRVQDLIGRSPLLAIPPWGYGAQAAMAEAAPPPAPAPGVAMEAAQPTVVDFHTDVRFPGQVSTFDHDLPLRVRLTLEKSAASVVDETFSLEYLTPEPKQVLVVCNAEGFIIDSDDEADNTRTILVYMDRDSQWAVFLLTPDPDAGPGVRRISLDFVHQGRQAGTASFEVEVRDRPPIDQTRVEPEPVIVDRNADGSIAERVGGALLFASAGAPTPDFVLRITLSADRRKLSYMLHSPAGKLGYIYRRLGSVTLEADPRTFLENTLLRLSQMARASRKKLNEQQIKDAQQKLQEIGWDLYEQLVWPAAGLRNAYRDLRQLREKEEKLSLLVISDEPWIPWEMLLPHEDDLPDEDFLCAQFRMTRWLPGRGLPEDFGLHQARVVVPKSNLPSVKAEQDYFSNDLPKQRPDISYGGAWLDMASQVKEALREGDIQWFHFACHGDFDYTRPDESALQLKGDSLTPSQIVGPMRSGVAASRPLVFLNACHTAEAGFSLTRMGGWAERFVRAGASAFIGSLWEVNDVLAAEFAIKFYGEMLAGQTLGEAFHSARAHIRSLDDANPTWLAYTLYADPNGRVKAGDQ